MMKSTARDLLIKKLRSPNSSSTGFTLVELLVVVLIAGGIISGLLFLATELLTADSRESARTETQRDIRFALDYISGELREAIYVYPDTTSTTSSQSLSNAFNSVEGDPIIAFWKQQQLPKPLRENCDINTPAVDVPCLQGSSYSLIVYSLDTTEDPKWDGKARIVRSAMTQFFPDGQPNPNYVPLTSGLVFNFSQWPGGAVPQFNQSDVLSDFIDDGTGANAVGQVQSELCPNVNLSASNVTTYSVTPSTANSRSFYACISESSTSASPDATNQEVIVYLQGNADGRSGVIGEAGFLPTIEARVLSRGILDKNLAGTVTQ